MYAVPLVEGALIPWPLILVQSWKRYHVQEAAVETNKLPFIRGLDQVVILQPVLKLVQSGDCVLVGLKVGHTFLRLGVLIVVIPQHNVHNFMELDEQGVWVQHGVHPVEHKEHQLALLSHQSAVIIDCSDVILILQQAHKVHPFLHTLDAYITLIVFASCGQPWDLHFTGVGR